ncbi:hypothetical protein K493DRAFT_314378 [Basidiobolus meristosporus CBS 931.73]|uniref:TLC domain-containing protein n=1 Tax=Basidiobolus meristosporus CBS 931.73 TaxID=1314790 RepID=A0A1Y1YFL8_9FUNG|nr:hypothetical protein K493DRAFT_314378 [Basidiobolus meristosporus CBS 931.73]|eukprot:ORX96693.1 hypothetical protein K493DRAFT_314378 [Basidiobolus meristosporus CBS 931.73]
MTAYTPDSVPAPHRRAFPKSVFLACYGYPLLFILLHFVFRYNKFYQSLRPLHRFQLRNKLVATLHAAVATFCAIRIAFLSDWSQLHLIYNDHPETKFVSGLELGYLFQDTISELYKAARFGIYDKVTLIHHLAFSTGLVYYLVIYGGPAKGDYFIALILLMNASTPLLHLRWLFEKMNVVGARLWSVNIGLIGLFFTCRLYMVYFMYWIYAFRHQEPWYMTMFRIPWFCSVFSSALIILNGGWLYALCKRIFSKSGRCEAPVIVLKPKDPSKAL